MNKTKVMLRDDLLSTNNGISLLVAGKCPSCGSVYFPRRDHCLECHDEKMEIIELSQTGKLYTFTIVNMPAEHYAPPYAIGWVEFPEGVKVFGQIKGYEQVMLKIGMPVKVMQDVLWEEAEKEIVAYKFEPIK